MIKKKDIVGGKNMIVYGFLLTNSDGKRKRMVYEVGKEYSRALDATLPRFEFVVEPEDIFHGRNFTQKNNRIFFILAYGNVSGPQRSYIYRADNIRILREIPWKDIYRYFNFGEDNIGEKNILHENVGNRNVGNRNVGDDNNGDCNIGNRCIGDFNRTPHGCLGDWNTADYAFGAFNTKVSDKEINLFNQPSSWTFDMWRNSQACQLLKRVKNYFEPSTVLEENWNMTLGQIKQIRKKEQKQEFYQAYEAWWDDLTKKEKQIIRSIPNFDATVFYRVTGIHPEVYTGEIYSFVTKEKMNDEAKKLEKKGRKIRKYMDLTETEKPYKIRIIA